MRTSLFIVATSSLLLSAAFATGCGSSSSDGGSASGGTSGTAPGSDPASTPDASTRDAATGTTAAALTCASYTWCGSGTVSEWGGQTLPTARGGTIPNGLYREAYRLAEKGTGRGFGDYGSALLFRDGKVRGLGDLGRVGTFTTTKTPGTLDIAWTSNCDDQSGMDTAGSPSSSSYQYLVDDQGKLFLFLDSTGSDGAQTVAQVMLPRRRSARTSPPTSRRRPATRSCARPRTAAARSRATAPPARARVGSSTAAEAPRNPRARFSSLESRSPRLERGRAWAKRCGARAAADGVGTCV